MKLYKYRDFSHPKDDDFRRLAELLGQNAFWCARPSTLNDPDEFCWQCDYRLSDATAPLLAELLIKVRGRTRADAQTLAETSVSAGRIELLAGPIFKEMIERCRDEIGLACFGSSADNAVMWERYEGAGAGVCIEVETPPELLNSELFPVEYPPTKVLHVNQLLRAFLDPAQRRQVYSMALLSKSPFWAPEAELRFVSKRQGVLVHISGSSISRLVLGPNLDRGTLQRIEATVNSLSYDLPLSFCSAV
ncbi:MAG: hypothetical protein L0387_25685 [Acidobacteria bacterium]|nr:hypothetical protein [Acidobacteriota bacterium]MCI0624991.1 hypothetical protein [Acidobacteriota bacterium]MCI0717903.1 hypothetical protein [Acidobacteriota bacterium]